MLPLEAHDETDSKERTVQTCLSGAGTGFIDLTVLRGAACSPGGLGSDALRRHAWPKLVATHQVLLQQDIFAYSRLPTSRSCGATACDSSRLKTMQLRRLARSARWSKYTPFARVISNLSLDFSVSSPTSLSLWPAPSTRPKTQNHQYHETNARHTRQGTLEQDVLASEEHETLLQLLQHLQRCYPNLHIHQGTADMVSVVWRVLDRPSLTAITCLQLFQYHWQPLPMSAFSFFHELLERTDATLHQHLQQFVGNDGSNVPHCIQESWIPHWLSRDVENFELLTIIWDVLISSHPLAIM
jgi:hypothetical protein